MGMKTPCLGAHSGSLNKTLVARTRKLGASGDWAPIRQQPWKIYNNRVFDIHDNDDDNSDYTDNTIMMTVVVSIAAIEKKIAATDSYYM